MSSPACPHKNPPSGKTGKAGFLLSCRYALPWQHANLPKTEGFSCRNLQESAAALTGAFPFHYDIGAVVQETRLGEGPPGLALFLLYERGFD